MNFHDLAGCENPRSDGAIASPTKHCNVLMLTIHLSILLGVVPASAV